MLCVQGEVPQMRHHTRRAADRISVLVCVHDSSHERPPCCGEFGGGDRGLVCSAEFEKCHGAGDEGVGGMHPKGLHRPVLCSSQGAQTQISRQ